MADPLSGIVAIVLSASPYGLVAAAGAWSALRKRRRRAKIGRALGVETGPNGSSIVHRGVRMWIADPGNTLLELRARFHLPFDLGLEVGVTNLPHATKHSMFVQGVRFAASDAHRTPLVATRDVVAAIRRSPTFGRIQCSDEGVVLVVANTGSVEQIVSAMDVLAGIVDAFEAARPSIPVTPELAEYHAYFVDLAKDYDFTGVSCPLAMWGYLDGRRSSVVVTRAARATRLKVRVEFARPLGGVLEVHPETSSASFRLAGLADVAVGDSNFDQLFFVRSNDPERARTVLRGLSTKLLRVSEHTPFAIDDEGVDLHTSSLPPKSHVSALVEVARSIAQDVERGLGIPPPTVGADPYRGASPRR